MSSGPVKTAASELDVAKQAAARRAAAFVHDGMRIGLGTGSTADWLIRRLGARVRNEGLRIDAVPTSRRTATLAQSEGIAVRSLEDLPRLDLTIDGADEFDPAFDLIKGAGGALLREKIVASASDRMIVIADPTKQVARLGAFPLPIEIVPFGWKVTQGLVARCLEGFGRREATIALRMSGAAPYTTDEGNYIVDARVGHMDDARALCAALNQVPGVVDNGLFVGFCDTVVLGQRDGAVTVLARADRADGGV